MTYGNQGRAKRSWMRAVRCTVAIALAALLAWGQVPPVAWAEAADSISAAVSDASGLQTVAEESSDSADSRTEADEQNGATEAGPASSEEETERADQLTSVDTEGTGGSTADNGLNATQASEGTQEGVATASEESISVVVQVIGRDASGEVEDWTQEANLEVPAGSTAADASELLFKRAGLTAQYETGQFGWFLSTIADPSDSSRVLGWDEATGRYWQLFVNGSAADVGAGSAVLEPGDSVAWFYSSSGEGLPGAGSNEEAKTVTASLQVIGVDDEGKPQTWLPLVQATVPEGSTAADLTEMLFKRYGISANSRIETWGWSLNSITDPNDPTRSLGYNEATGAYWAFFVNGGYAESGAGSTVVQPGDTITWCYTASSITMPEGDVALNPDAEHPDIGSSWPGFADGGSGAVVEGVDTPTGSGSTAWKHSLLTDDERASYASSAASDPIIANGKIYLVCGSSTYDANNNWAETKSLGRLEVINASTGAVERSITLARGLDSTCRPVYSDGIIVIPLVGGYLQAVSASTLETIWTVDAIEGAQCISTLTVSDGCVYVATADSLGSNGGVYYAESGTLRCVNLYTGALVGALASDSAGYYWAGGISAKGYFVIGDDAGEVVVYSSDLSQRLSSTKLSAYVHSSLVQADGYIYAVTADGVLYKLALSDSGVVSEEAACQFAGSSTSTPAIVNGVAYAGGSRDGSGVLATIDLGSMSVKASVNSYTDGSDDSTIKLPGDVKSAPLVSVRADGTYIYFTSNGLPGGIYSYRVGDKGASLLFEPEESDRNYSISSVVCGPDGTLYFTNDSGNLFAVRAENSDVPDSDGGNSNAGNANGPAGGNGGSENGSGSKTGSGSQATRTSLRTSGAVSPAARPVSADGSTDASASSDEQGEAVETASASSSSASAASAAASRTEVERGGIPQWAPAAGIVVGVCGLAAIGAYLTTLRKRG